MKEDSVIPFLWKMCLTLSSLNWNTSLILGHDSDLTAVVYVMS